MISQVNLEKQSESRKKFEEWLHTSGLHKFVDMRVQKNGLGPNEYMAWDMQLAFRAWQAARGEI